MTTQLQQYQQEQYNKIAKRERIRYDEDEMTEMLIFCDIHLRYDLIKKFVASP